MNHFVRIGVLGVIGRFRAVDSRHYARGTRVLCRTERGLEIGEVRSIDDSSGTSIDGDLLRALTDSDELLAARLRKNRDAAFEACSRLLAERGSASVLVDVEHLFDGRGLYFYFLGSPDSIAENLSAELATTYDAEARTQQFADTLETGCGPGCGTPEAAGNGCGTSGGCSTCAIAGGCGTSAGR